MSAAFGIKGAIIERLQKYPFFARFTFGQSQSRQIQPEDLPYCGVYQLPEVQLPDGDANAGEPKLKSESILGVSIILSNIESEELEQALDTAFDIIMVGLLQDATFIGFRPVGTYDIEGVSRVTRQHVFGTLGSTNQVPIGELRVEMTFITRYEYPPDIVDWLKLVHLETAYPSLEEAASVQQVIVPINLPTGDDDEGSPSGSP
jgi:hypothetical protein